MHFANLYWWLYIITVHQASSASFSLVGFGFVFFFFLSCCFFEEHDYLSKEAFIIIIFSTQAQALYLREIIIFFQRGWYCCTWCIPVFENPPLPNTQSLLSSLACDCNSFCSQGELQGFLLNP